MRTVFKYEIGLNNVTELSLPREAQPISVMMQNGSIQMWALVNPDWQEHETRYFRLAGTGHPIQEKIKSHIGSIQFHDGTLIFHLFEVER